MSAPPFDIQFTPAAFKDFNNLSPDIQIRIRNKLKKLSNGEGNAKPLVGIEGNSARVGSWRIIFTVKESIILVTKIGSRGGVYNKLTRRN